MKKIILSVAVLVALLSTNKSFGQTTGTANLNITLSSVLSLTVSQPASLNVNFNDVTKYTNGIVADADDHLTVVSSSGYTIKAISGAITGPSSLTAASVKITTSIGTSNLGNTTGLASGYVTDLVLPAVGGTALAVVTAPNTSWLGVNSSNKFKVSYNIGSGSQYVNKAYGANVIPVIYTITQP
ncbi:hypothetical protein [Pedobacter frigoris]|uniref:hypothetical protein n=1 Tax=Pedobacter frigoris TaxID=2571272 RepID=UPI0029314E26|nr:hypothetical protein [Pedobacter frigoris]